MTNTFPAWFYSPKGEAEIFGSEEEVPKGWKDSPAAFKEAKADAHPELQPDSGGGPDANDAGNDAGGSGLEPDGGNDPVEAQPKPRRNRRA